MQMTGLGKFRQLAPRDRLLLFRSLLLLPVIHTALLMLDYSRLQSAMERMIPLKKDKALFSRSEFLPEVRGIARIVSIAAQHGPYKATCLRRSLLVWWFLREEGIASQICFGVRLLDRQLEAHAWVEVG